MFTLRRLLLVLSLVSALVPMLSQSASACTCGGATREQLADYADVIFTGIAESVTAEETRYITRFDVTTSYKGKPIPERFIHSGTQESACGVKFGQGVKYTIFASRANDGKLWTGLCSGNKQGRIRHARYGLPPGERV